MEESLLHPTLFVEVLFPLPLARPYTYKISAQESIQVGNFVRVPFGNRCVVGVIWKILASAPLLKSIKEVEEILSLAPLPKQLCAFISWVARYTLSSEGSVLKLAMGEASLFKKNKEPKNPSAKKSSQEKPLKEPEDILQLLKKEEKTSLLYTQDQEDAIKTLQEKIQNHEFSVSLLDGVTGSGKTEVYFEGLEEALKKNGQILVLLPEISLSAQWSDRFKKRFGYAPFIWHSDLAPKVRNLCWKEVASGKASVIVGARSALFLPFSNLQLIIVDEEHDLSFKQDEGVLYHARDMAIVRAKLENIPVLLASATPSLESLLNVKLGRFHRIHLAKRAQSAELPNIEMIDMRQCAKELKEISKKEGRMAFLSPLLRQALRETCARGEQSLLFLNRRGYAPLTLCRGCGYRFSCPNCSAWLVLHQTSSFLQCHHCGHKIKCPQACPQCQAEDMFAACGPGVERIFEEVTTFLPEARIALLSSDTLSSMEKVQDVLEEILSGKVDVLIGTQVVAKGHHFPNLTLVGVVDADLGLSGGDLRASEKTYQILHQVSGRSGRSFKKGRALLQTFCPEHSVMRALLSGDRDRFLEEEADAREMAQMPPFGKLAALIITSPKSQEAEAVARALAKVAPFRENITILGPAPAPLYQLGRRFRWRFLIKATKEAPLHGLLEGWISQVKIPKTTKVHVDIDPYRFL